MNRTFVAILATLILASCQTVVTDPAASLRDSSNSRKVHEESLRMIMASQHAPEKATIDALQGLVYRPGYDTETRLEGMRFLLQQDPTKLKRTIRQRLPRVTDHAWLRALCQFVADYDLKELDVALVSSWGRPWSGNLPEVQRPEYLALTRMLGPSGAVDAVWTTFLGAVKPSENGLRYRCWDLLHRLGARNELIELVIAENATGSEHPTLRSVHEAAVDFGTIPWNREELLWVHKLTEPTRQIFWQDAQQATTKLSHDRRRCLELRDLPVAVASARHHPELLIAEDMEIFASLQSRLAGRPQYKEQNGGFLPGQEPSHDLAAHHNKLTWGDLAAMSIALDAMEIANVRHHLFDYAERDRLDEGTEYGGVVALDEQGRFEILEFPPRFRVHDLRFEAPQAMFDAGYTALFHFHYHTQKYRNKAHAGPGLGDMNYANATRANCLVLTYVDENTLNVDFYRHDGVLVDLGVIRRPGIASVQT
ncbi:MAG: hypothetical protein MK077_08960 [Phycisphaerales bacterium]|nr:hypothetical protein [Phycisphaerales bacterium]